MSVQTISRPVPRVLAMGFPVSRPDLILVGPAGYQSAQLAK